MSNESTTILLISGDPRTLQICRTGLDAMRGNDRNLICARPEDVLVPVDLYIWDLDSGAELPNSLYFGQEPQHIFLIRREQLCKLILTRHHGRVWAESDGEGTTFSLVLPFARKESHPGTVDMELAAPAVAG